MVMVCWFTLILATVVARLIQTPGKKNLFEAYTACLHPSYLKASESEWSNQKQIELKFLSGKIITYMEMIGIFTQVQYHEMPATINVRYLTRYIHTSYGLIYFRYRTCHEMSLTVNKCQVSYLEMLGTHPIAKLYNYNNLLNCLAATTAHVCVHSYLPQDLHKSCTTTKVLLYRVSLQKPVITFITGKPGPQAAGGGVGGGSRGFTRTPSFGLQKIL